MPASEYIGTAGADTLAGSAGDDIIGGLAGDDRLSGLAGNDTLDGGDGSDTLEGGDGNDVLLGGDGADSLNGGYGIDRLDGGAGNDTLFGGGGFAGTGLETLLGGEGDDLLVGDGSLSGGAGNDLLRRDFSSSGPITLDGGAGDADRIGFPGSDLSRVTIIGVEFLELPALANGRWTTGFSESARLAFDKARITSLPTISSTNPGYVLTTGGGDFSGVTLVGPTGIDNVLGDLVIGTSGNDVLSVMYGGTARGGAGNDSFITGLDGVSTGPRQTAFTYGRENIFGEDGDDVITIQLSTFGTFDATAAPAVINGGTGWDTLWIRSVSGGVLTSSTLSGIEVLRPSFGVTLTAEQFAGLVALDIRPFDGSIALPFSYTNSQTYPVGALPSFTGSGGTYDFSTKIFTTDNRVVFTGGSGNERVLGAAGNDTLAGGAGQDALFGNAGNDSLDGGVGDDALVGGAGNDILNGGEGNDVLNAGAGQNTAAGGLGFDTLHLDGGRRAATISTSLEFTTVDGASRIPSLAGTATTAGQTTSFTGMEKFAFAEGDLFFDTGSPAFATARLYLAALGRAPDPLGLADNVALLNGTISFSQLSASFAASPEFNLRYPAVDNAGFVNLMYQNTLGRAPDAQGFAFWTNILDQGLGTRGTILEGFANSAEFIARAQTLLPNGVWLPDTDASAVARVYQATLGRHPDEAGLSYWRGTVEAGFSLRELVPLFLSSPEAQARYGTQDDAGFLTTLYRNVLERAPDAEGYAYWGKNLAAGMARADVVMLFSQSPEFIAETAPWIADGIDFAG